MAVTAIAAAAAGQPPLAALLQPLAAAAAASLPPHVAAWHSCRVQPAVAAAPRSDGPELPVLPALQPPLASPSSKAQPPPPPALELGEERPNETIREWLCSRFFQSACVDSAEAARDLGRMGCNGVACEEGDLGIRRDSVGTWERTRTSEART
ncbi:unnamed protein product [Miscanthus lutarioriparius]|uniref:Uncharacterized protein n=1 Tax=Miscanthus lutarioriparius TaxID=422564 RepID=A0A811QY62_9POAL|nr:unnamed protein product [Miscanthus lutarioriparius]